MYNDDPVPEPAAFRTDPLCVLVVVAVKLLIQTSSKSTSIRLMEESSITMFSRFRAPDVLPG